MGISIPEGSKALHRQPAMPVWAAAPAPTGVSTELVPGLCGDAFPRPSGGFSDGLQAGSMPGPFRHPAENNLKLLARAAGVCGEGAREGAWEAPRRAGTGPVTAPPRYRPWGGPAPCAGRGGASVGGGAPGSPGRHRPALSVPAAAGGTRALLRSRGGGVRPRPRAVAASAVRAPPSPGGGIAPGSSEEKEEEEAAAAAAGLRGAASAPSPSRSARLQLRLQPLAPGWALGSRGAMSARRRRRPAAEEEETAAAEEAAGSDKVRARGWRPLAAVGAGVRARAAPAPRGGGRGPGRGAASPPPHGWPGPGCDARGAPRWAPLPREGTFPPAPPRAAALLLLLRGGSRERATCQAAAGPGARGLGAHPCPDPLPSRVVPCPPPRPRGETEMAASGFSPGPPQKRVELSGCALPLAPGRSSWARQGARFSGVGPAWQRGKGRGTVMGGGWRLCQHFPSNWFWFMAFQVIGIHLWPGKDLQYDISAKARGFRNAKSVHRVHHSGKTATALFFCLPWS